MSPASLSSLSPGHLLRSPPTWQPSPSSTQSEHSTALRSTAQLSGNPESTIQHRAVASGTYHSATAVVAQLRLQTCVLEDGVHPNGSSDPCFRIRAWTHQGERIFTVWSPSPRETRRSCSSKLIIIPTNFFQFFVPYLLYPPLNTLLFRWSRAIAALSLSGARRSELQVGAERRALHLRGELARLQREFDRAESLVAWLGN
jgi:hypothetical protein